MGREVLKIDAQPRRDINKGSTRAGSRCRRNTPLFRPGQPRQSGKQEKQHNDEENVGREVLPQASRLHGSFALHAGKSSIGRRSLKQPTFFAGPKRSKAQV